jgi:hypothetical protein
MKQIVVLFGGGDFDPVSEHDCPFPPKKEVMVYTVLFQVQKKLNYFCYREITFLFWCCDVRISVTVPNIMLFSL